MSKIYDRLIKVEFYGKMEMDGTDDDIYTIIETNTDPESKYLIDGEDAVEMLMSVIEQLEKSNEEK